MRARSCAARRERRPRAPASRASWRARSGATSARTHAQRRPQSFTTTGVAPSRRTSSTSGFAKPPRFRTATRGPARSASRQERPQRATMQSTPTRHHDRRAGLVVVGEARAPPARLGRALGGERRVGVQPRNQPRHRGRVAPVGVAVQRSRAARSRSGPCTACSSRSRPATKTAASASASGLQAMIRKPSADQERPEVQRVTQVCVGPGDGERVVLVQVAGRPQAQALAERDRERPGGDRRGRRAATARAPARQRVHHEQARAQPLLHETHARRGSRGGSVRPAAPHQRPQVGLEASLEPADAARWPAGQRRGTARSRRRRAPRSRSRPRPRSARRSARPEQACACCRVFRSLIPCAPTTVRCKQGALGGGCD